MAALQFGVSPRCGTRVRQPSCFQLTGMPPRVFLTRGCGDQQRTSRTHIVYIHAGAIVFERYVSWFPRFLQQDQGAPTTCQIRSASL